MLLLIVGGLRWILWGRRGVVEGGRSERGSCRWWGQVEGVMESYIWMGHGAWKEFIRAIWVMDRLYGPISWMSWKCLTWGWRLNQGIVSWACMEMLVSGWALELPKAEAGKGEALCLPGIRATWLHRNP
jgi:hypothetical protein